MAEVTESTFNMGSQISDRSPDPTHPSSVRPSEEKVASAEGKFASPVPIDSSMSALTSPSTISPEKLMHMDTPTKSRPVDPAVAPPAETRGGGAAGHEPVAASQLKLPTSVGATEHAASVQKVTAEMPEPKDVIPPFTQSSKCGCLYWFTRSIPTNYDMLIFRTLNKELGRPNCNEDYLAVALRDELMPTRSWTLKHLPWVKHQTLAALESPLFGVPGCINFIDARTKWFDLAVNEAISVRGIKQVVVIAAGFDTRAYRFAQPGVRFIEIDLPNASERKQNLATKLGWKKPYLPSAPPPSASSSQLQLQALHAQALAKEADDAASSRPHPCSLASSPEYVAADLSQKDLRTALQGTAFDPSQPTLFTMEYITLKIYWQHPPREELLCRSRVHVVKGDAAGLIYYLSNTSAHRLVQSIGDVAAPGSILQFDYMNIQALKTQGKGSGVKGDHGFPGFKVTAQSVCNKGEPYLSGLDPTPEAVQKFVSAHGFRLQQHLLPRDMVSLMLPHLKVKEGDPVPIANFYCYATVLKEAA